MIMYCFIGLFIAGYLMYLAWKCNPEVKEIRKKNKEYAKWQEMYFYNYQLNKRDDNNGEK